MAACVSQRGMVFAILAGGMASLAGCGGSAPAPAASAQVTAPAPAVAAAPAAPVAPAAPAAAPARSTATKWIGGIPYDVFYDRPLEVASDGTPLVAAATPAAVTPVSAAPAAVTPAAAPMPTPTPTAAPAAAGAAAIDWATIAPIEVVSEEITALRNELQAKLNTLADYNKSWESIGPDATELAALAGVVERHPGDVSWKANAKIARKLAEEINANAAKTGRSAFDATKAPYDSLVDLFNGNAPQGVEADDMAPFGDFVDRSTLMEKLEQSHAYLKSNITTQPRLEENPAEIKRKLTVLATLMNVVMTEGYDYTSEGEYKGFAQGFANAALAGRDAVDAKDLAAFTAAVAEMQKGCTDCHAKYAFGGSSF